MLFSYYTGMFHIKLFLISIIYREYMFELISGPWQAYTWNHGVCGQTIKFVNSDIRGIVHYEFVPTGQTANQVYYLEVLK